MLPTFFRQSVTRIRPGTKTIRGQDMPDWSNVSTAVINGCSVQPADARLSQDGRVLGTTDGLTVYMPADADVLAGDRIQYDGLTYIIDGVPRHWPSASGRLDHILLNLERWAG